MDSVVGQLTATDPDNARSPRQTHTYALTSDAGGRFAVDGDSLVVSGQQPHTVLMPIPPFGHGHVYTVSQIRARVCWGGGGGLAGDGVSMCVCCI